ncbi:MAG TPA: hypothetical protein PLJ43_11090, partial [Chitinophagales bacterium]|nr:hypothetical protein [Chitinophagales bacterium]
MNETVMYVIIGAAALLLGILGGRLIFAPSKNQEALAKKEAEEIIALAKKDAELITQKSKTEADTYKKERS